MNIQERIAYLFEKNPNKKKAHLAKLIGTKQSTIDGWTKLGRCPSSDVIVKVANFFNVSVDYLLGNENSVKGYAGTGKSEFLNKQLEGIDFALYGATKDLTDEQKQDVIDFANYIKNKDNSQA